jgi:hypothetical protein
MTKRCKIGDLCLITGGNPEYVGMTCEVVGEPDADGYFDLGPDYVAFSNCDPARDWIVQRGGMYALWYDCYLMPIRPDGTQVLETQRDLVAQ